MSLNDQMWMQRITAEERGRLLEYVNAWQAYFGQIEKPLRVKPGQPDDNVRINLARMTVDTGVMFLFGDDVTFDLDAQSDTRTPAETWLDACWDANGKARLLLKLGLNGGVCGHAFLKIVGRQPFPRLINISPEYVSVVTDPDDIDAVWRYIIQYPAVGRDGKRLTIRQVIERGESETWTITDQVAAGDAAFQTRSVAAWPWAWCPIVDCQNLPSPNEFYGISDLEQDIIDLNKSVNFILSNATRILRYHAHPKTWGRGFRASELRVAADEIITLEAPDAELHNLEMESDLTSSIAMYDRLKMAYHQVTRTPEIAAGRVENLATLSGIALRILYGPLLALTRMKRLTYGDLLVNINRRLLDMAGFGPDNVTKLTWRDPLPANTMEQRQVALLDQQLGVSSDTILTALGYDPDEEREKSERAVGALGEQLLTAFDRGAETVEKRPAVR